MATYGPALIERILGYAALAPDWHLGLYYDGEDPVASLATAEIERIALPTMVEGIDGSWSNQDEFLVGPLDACTVAGWFLANGATEQDVIWVTAFATPVSVDSGNYAKFPAGSVKIAITA